MGLYERLQQYSEELSESFFDADVAQAQRDLEELAAEFDEQARQALAVLEETGSDMGALFIEGVGEGMRAEYESLLMECSAMADALTAQWREAWDVHSPSRVAMELGENYIKGLEMGVADEARNLELVMARAIPSELTVPSRGQFAARESRGESAALVNAFGTLVAGLRTDGGGSPVEVVVKLESGVELARALLPDIRAVGSQSPALVPG
jgi:hypothetical protein